MAQVLDSITGVSGEITHTKRSSNCLSGLCQQANCQMKAQISHGSLDMAVESASPLSLHQLLFPTHQYPLISAPYPGPPILQVTDSKSTSCPVSFFSPRRVMAVLTEKEKLQREIAKLSGISTFPLSVNIPVHLHRLISCRKNQPYSSKQCSQIVCCAASTSTLPLSWEMVCSCSQRSRQLDAGIGKAESKSRTRQPEQEQQHAADSVVGRLSGTSNVHTSR